MKKIITLIWFFTAIFVSNAQHSYPITFTHDSITVFGTFTVPDTTGVFPTIIINPGSGAIDRDGTLSMIGGNLVCLYPGLANKTLKYYKQLSDALVDAGYAVLRYDKLEYTYTPATIGSITFNKLWLPVSSAIEYIKTRSDVDTNSIILIGHSEGSSLIPYIAKGRNDIKALISIAGPRTPIDSTLAYQLVAIADTCNGNLNQAQAQANQILSYFNVIRTNTWNSSTPSLFGIPPDIWYDYIKAVDSVSVNYNTANLPTLFTGLGLDFNVPPSELIRLQNEVTITNDFWSIQGLNHYMTTNNDPNVSIALTDTIIYWLNNTVLSTEDTPQNHQIKNVRIYPNPFKSELNISITDPNSKHLEILVNSITGQNLIRMQLPVINGSSNQSITLSSLPVGMYLISLVADGNKTTWKIIKQQ